jgi:hypothetical protein
MLLIALDFQNAHESEGLGEVSPYHIETINRQLRISELQLVSLPTWMKRLYTQ